MSNSKLSDKTLFQLLDILTRFQKCYYPNDETLSLRFATVRYCIREQLNKRKVVPLD